VDALVHEGLAPLGRGQLLQRGVKGPVVFQVPVFAEAQHDVQHRVAGDVLQGVGHLAALEVGHRALDPGHGFLVCQALGRARYVVEQGPQGPHRVQVAGHGASVWGSRERNIAIIVPRRRRGGASGPVQGITVRVMVCKRDFQ
jgi:hypothetical protein